MKLHNKEWHSVILTRPSSEDSGKHSLHEILPATAGVWNLWDKNTRIDNLYLFRSENRYFQFSGEYEQFASYFEDRVFPRLYMRGTSRKIEYPIYALERLTSDSTIVIISAPYAGLLSEVVSSLVQKRIGESLQFVRPLIREIYSMARAMINQPSSESAEEALRADRTSMVLRGGRITLSVDESSAGNPSGSGSIRSLTLVGNNILKSQLFARLVDEGLYGLKFGLDPSLAKVAFKHGTNLGVVVKMDQFGNFHFRPGFAGRNLEGVGDLMTYCTEKRATSSSYALPIVRTLEPDL